MSSILKIRTPKKEIIELEANENFYFKLNQNMFREMCNIIYYHDKYACQIIGHSKKYIQTWIDEALPILHDSYYTIATKVFWVLHGIVDWNDDRVRCKNRECNRPFINKNAISLFQGYHVYCSCKCSAQAEETRQKYVNTSNLQFGADNWMKVKGNIIKLQDNFEKKYGDGMRSPMQVPEFRAEFENSMLSAHGGRYTFECEDLMKKVNETNLKNFGTMFPSQTQECKDKAKASFIKHYGVDHNMKCDLGKEKVYEGLKRAYNLPDDSEIHSPAQIPQVAKKISVSLINMSKEKKEEKLNHYEKTCIDEYGVKNTFLLPSSKKSFIDKYGVEYPMQNKDVQRKARRKYSYDNFQFDSAPELAYYVWLKDNSIKFKFQPGHSFEYEHNGKKFLYFPDFFIEDEQQFVEIKGDHFFTESEQMICPFRKKKWSDERYVDECAKYEAKHQCMLKNNVKIMRSNEYMKFVQYIKDKYEKDFFENVRSRK